MKDLVECILSFIDMIGLIILIVFGIATGGAVLHELEEKKDQE